MELEIVKQATDLALVCEQRIVDQATLDKAGQALLTGKDLIRTIKAYFAPLKQDAHLSWKSICDRENEELAKINPTVLVLDRMISDYHADQQRKRREAEETARKQKQELDRLAEKTLLEAQAAPPAEQDRILKEGAAREREIAVPAAATVAQTTLGLAPRTYWKAVVFDLRVLAKAVADGTVSTEVILPNQVFLNDLATKTKGMARIPGVKWESETRMMKTR